MTTEERAGLLAKIREGLSDLAEARRDLDRQSLELHAQLEQLDGLAQRVALSGLLQHGVDILDHQHALSAELAEVERERMDLAAMEERLLIAERRLTGGSSDQPSGMTGDGEMPLSRDVEPAPSTERLRSLPRLESASS